MLDTLWHDHCCRNVQLIFNGVRKLFSDLIPFSFCLDPISNDETFFWCVDGTKMGMHSVDPSLALVSQYIIRPFSPSLLLRTRPLFSLHHITSLPNHFDTFSLLLLLQHPLSYNGHLAGDKMGGEQLVGRWWEYLLIRGTKSIFGYFTGPFIDSIPKFSCEEIGGYSLIAFCVDLEGIGWVG
jgi:hypothetical protein